MTEKQTPARRNQWYTEDINIGALFQRSHSLSE
jgi:hypothetical protein